MTPRLFITADTHFGHVEALERFNRPFGDVDAMDDALVRGINDVVGPDDLLYHLGDFVGPRPEPGSRTRHAQSIRERIDCRKIVLVRGNQDPRGKPDFDRLFDSTHEILSFKGWNDAGGEGPHRVVMCHYGLRAWQGRPGGSLHLYGHTHGTLPETGRSTDVGVDCWRHRPQPLGEVLAMLAGREVDMDSVRSRLQPDR
jgi:calcineurin-like phosphoesterase family protein